MRNVTYVTYRRGLISRLNIFTFQRQQHNTGDKAKCGGIF